LISHSFVAARWCHVCATFTWWHYCFK